uniref:Uncharacterized protein n=1 Tax=Glossina palpalis gambiensis TaxID=67801 RepID=A0A1B0BS16_9MUSC
MDNTLNKIFFTIFSRISVVWMNLREHSRPQNYTPPKFSVQTSWLNAKQTKLLYIGISLANVLDTATLEDDDDGLNKQLQCIEKYLSINYFQKNNENYNNKLLQYTY